jgi:hypothetical protein
LKIETPKEDREKSKPCSLPCAALPYVKLVFMYVSLAVRIGVARREGGGQTCHQHSKAAI